MKIVIKSNYKEIKVKKYLFLFCMLALPLLMLANAIPNDLRAHPLYAPNIVKVQLTPGAINRTNLPRGLYAEADKFGLPELDKIMVQFGGTKVLRAHIRLKDTTWEQKNGVDRWFLVRFKSDVNVLDAIREFKTSKYIETATPEYYAYTQAIPNDALYPNNWGHNNTAQLPYYTGGSHSGAGVGTIGFDSNAQAAWDDTQGYGSASTIIAIIDTGVDTTHPDLRLVTGYDYGDNDSNPMDDSADPGHGTACSGICAGIGNNSIGVAGMAAGCSVMPLKIASADGSLGFTAIENALYHAGDNNVDVASMSFGASMSVGSSPSTDTALAYAYNHGVVLFAATANGDTSTISYPAKYPNVIAVGAASPTGQRKSATSSDGEYWWGSNYGVNTQDSNDAVDICAPTILPATDIVGAGGYDTGNYSMWFNGTSCATPYAAGVAGLLLSKNPSLTPAEVWTAIKSSATDMTSDGGAGWDRYTGYGLVNAQGALASLVPGMPTCDITAPLYGASYYQGDIITVEVTATDPASKNLLRVDFYLDGSTTPTFTDNSPPYAWAWNTTGYTGGNHTILASAVDNENNVASDQVTILLLIPANEGFETGNFNAYTWVQSGNLPWVVQSTDKYTGTYAAKSGAITHSQTSTMALSLNITAAGNISFAQKVSSESGYDFLKFYVDSSEIGSWSGAGVWSNQSYPVTTGIHEFKWTYYKDGSLSTGSDCGYIDHIIFPPYVISNPPQITWFPTSFSQSLETNQTASQDLSIGNTGNQTLNYTVTKPSPTSTILNESFENGGAIPVGWTQEYVTGTTSWVFAAGGNSSHPAAAYDGSYNARLYRASTTARVTKLVTPSMNISGVTSATLTFWHTQALSSPNQDELRVYYRTSSSGTWTLLTTYTSNITVWTLETISLPNINSTYYVAFEGTAKYGYGVCVDKVQISTLSPDTSSWLTLNSGSIVNGSILDGQPNQVINVGFNSTGLADATYTSNITVTSNSVSNSSISIPVTLTVSSLPPATPQNLHFVFNGFNLELHWDSVSRVISYKIYEADTPNGTWTLKATASSNVYIQSISGLTFHKFYKVTANNTP
jgi:subtilisin family serine protease